MCKFFVAHNGSPVVLGMQDIDKIDLQSINYNYNSKNRPIAEKDNKNNYKSPRQTEGLQAWAVRRQGTYSKRTKHTACQLY